MSEEVRVMGLLMLLLGAVLGGALGWSIRDAKARADEVGKKLKGWKHDNPNHPYNSGTWRA